MGAVPCYCAVVLLLGGLGLPLEGLAEGALDPPVGGVGSGGGDLLDVGHELGQVLQGLPVAVDGLHRGFYLYCSFNPLGHTVLLLVLLNLVVSLCLQGI